MKYLASIIFCLILNHTYCQLQSSELRDSIFERIKSDETGINWQYDSISENLSWTMIDTMYIEFWCCGPPVSWYQLEKVDTVIVSLWFDDGWTTERLKNQIKENRKIIKKLSRKYIRYGNSVRWKYKMSKEGFLENKYHYLSIYPRFSRNGIYNIKDVVRIPDTIINNVGVYLDLSFEYGFYYIYQENPAKLLESQLEFISKDILGENKFLNGRFEYD